MITEWISVDEKMPPPDQWVLAWTGKYHWIAKFSSRFNMWIGVYENEYWRTPTHWMSLPERPD